MKFLMCKEGKNNPSYIYMWKAKGEWEFKKNGFYYDEKGMSNDRLMEMLKTAGADLTCAA